MQPAYLPEGRPVGPGRLWNAFSGLCSLWAAGFCLSIPVFVTGGGAAFLLPVPSRACAAFSLADGFILCRMADAGRLGRGWCAMLSKPRQVYGCRSFAVGLLPLCRPPFPRRMSKAGRWTGSWRACPALPLRVSILRPVLAVLRIVQGVGSLAAR